MEVHTPTEVRLPETDHQLNNELDYSNTVSVMSLAVITVDGWFILPQWKLIYT